MMGVYRDVHVRVEYTKTAEVFIPCGEPADEVIENAIYELVDELPEDVDGFGMSDFTYEEV